MLTMRQSDDVQGEEEGVGGKEARGKTSPPPPPTPTPTPSVSVTRVTNEKLRKKKKNKNKPNQTSKNERINFFVTSADTSIANDRSNERE
jgi:hypothetical protein